MPGIFYLKTIYYKKIRLNLHINIKERLDNKLKLLDCFFFDCL